MSAGEPEALGRLQELLNRLEAAHKELEKTEDAERAVEILRELAELARDVQAEIEQARRDAPDELA